MNRKAIAIVGVIISLWLVGLVLSQGAIIAESIADAPTWLAPVLAGASTVIGAITVLVFVTGIAFAIITYGRQIIEWFKGLFDDTATQLADIDESGQVKAITKTLAQTVIDLDRNGTKSTDLLLSTQQQASALVELAKRLSKTASDHAVRAQSFQQALNAIASNDPLRIAEAAGQVKDADIRSLLLMPFSQVDESYWQSTANLIATQVGNAVRWQGEYSQLAVSLLSEIAHIKTGLTALAANIDAAETARPLLEAKVNLNQAGRYLRLAVSEQSSPTKLFAP